MKRLLAAGSGPHLAALCGHFATAAGRRHNPEFTITSGIAPAGTTTR